MGLAEAETLGITMMHLETSLPLIRSFNPEDFDVFAYLVANSEVMCFSLMGYEQISLFREFSYLKTL